MSACCIGPSGEDDINSELCAVTIVSADRLCPHSIYNCSTRLDGWDWGAQDRTLVLVLRKGCHFCEDSAPFYQRLVARQQQGDSKTPIVAVFPDTADAVKEVVRSESLGVRALAGVPLEKLKVSGTPTLLLVDKSGKVLNTWTGMLSPRQELDVMKETACPGGTCREVSLVSK